MPVTVDVSGFVASLGKAAAELEHATAAHAAAADVVLRAAVAGAPRRTGRLRAAGHVTVDASGGLVTFDVPYAGYVNYGTRRMRADGFLTDAVAASEHPVGEVYAAAVADAFAAVHN